MSGERRKLGGARSLLLRGPSVSGSVSAGRTETGVWRCEPVALTGTGLGLAWPACSPCQPCHISQSRVRAPPQSRAQGTLWSCPGSAPNNTPCTGASTAQGFVLSQSGDQTSENKMLAVVAASGGSREGTFLPLSGLVAASPYGWLHYHMAS